MATNDVVVSTMPVRLSIAKTSHDPPLGRLATNIGDISGPAVAMAATP